LKPIITGLLFALGLVLGPVCQRAFAVADNPVQSIQDFPTVVEQGFAFSTPLAKPKAQSQATSKTASQNAKNRSGWTEYRNHHIHLSSRGGYSNYPSLDMEATAYDPGPISCGPHANGHTYTGMIAGFGVVAVDPRVVPLGTRVYVEGYGEGVAADIGGAIKGNRIDLCYNTYGEAIRFGRHHVKVYLLGR